MTSSPRHTWYNALLDEARDYDDVLNALEQYAGNQYERTFGGLNTPTPEQPANLISSLCHDGYHRPLLDMDDFTPETFDLVARRFKGKCVIVASSTPGHAHCYASQPVSWVKYVELLEDMAADEVITDGYLSHCIRRGQSLLRPPWVTKLQEC